MNLDLPVLFKPHFVKVFELRVHDRQRRQVDEVGGGGPAGQKLAEGIDLVRVGQIDVKRADHAGVGRDQGGELVHIAAALGQHDGIRRGVL